MGRKFVDGINEKNVDQNKPNKENGKVQNMEGIWQNLIFPFLNVA